MQYVALTLVRSLTLCPAEAVRVNGEAMTMTKGETELELIPFVEGGELLVLWQLHREGLGNAVELTTGRARDACLAESFPKHWHTSTKHRSPWPRQSSPHMRTAGCRMPCADACHSLPVLGAVISAQQGRCATSYAAFSRCPPPALCALLQLCQCWAQICCKWSSG